MPLRVASVGAGYFAAFQLAAWQRMDGVTLTGIAEPDAARRADAAQRYGCPVWDQAATMVAKIRPDILDIATPPASHAALIRAGLDAGVGAIVCQKPFALDLATARTLTAEADAQATPLIVHENFRFQPWYREAAALIGSGRLGALCQARFHLRPGDGSGADAYLDRQPYFRTMPRFLIHETGIHFIDVFRYLLGEPTAIYADLRRINPVIVGEDAGLVIFDFGAGCRAVFDGNRTLDHAARNHRRTLGELEVEGSAATLRLDGDGGLHLRPRGAAAWQAHGYEWMDRDFGGDCVQRFQEHVRDGLAGRRPLETLAAAYLRNLEIEAAIYRSAAEGAKLPLGPAGVERGVQGCGTGGGDG